MAAQHPRAAGLSRQPARPGARLKACWGGEEVETGEAQAQGKVCASWGGASAARRWVRREWRRSPLLVWKSRPNRRRGGAPRDLVKAGPWQGGARQLLLPISPSRVLPACGARTPAACMEATSFRLAMATGLSRWSQSRFRTQCVMDPPQWCLLPPFSAPAGLADKPPDPLSSPASPLRALPHILLGPASAIFPLRPHPPGYVWWRKA